MINAPNYMKVKIKIIIPLVLFIAMCIEIQAQQSLGGVPVSLQKGHFPSQLKSSAVSIHFGYR